MLARERPKRSAPGARRADKLGRHDEIIIAEARIVSLLVDIVMALRGGEDVAEIESSFRAKRRYGAGLGYISGIESSRGTRGETNWRAKSSAARNMSGSKSSAAIEQMLGGNINQICGYSRRIEADGIIPVASAASTGAPAELRLCPLMGGECQRRS